MTSDKTSRQNRVREALGKLYDQHPPYFREYLRRFKEDPTSRVFAPLAECYRRMGRIEEAIDICREGLEHHPDFHGGRVALAKCFVDKKLFAQARGELERVVQSAPENLLAQRLLADTYLALSNPQAALHCYKMALLLSPSDVGLAEKVHALESGEPQRILAEIPALSIPLEDPHAGSPAPPAPPAAPQQALSTGWDGMGSDEEAGQALADLDPEPEPEGWKETQNREDPDDDGGGDGERAEIDRLLGFQDTELDEAFKIEHVSAIFGEPAPDSKREITTSTLGDLYYSQGQFDRALKIFEKIHQKRPAPEIARKINACRLKLGVDRDAIVRNRRIQALRGILKRVRQTKPPAGI